MKKATISNLIFKKGKSKMIFATKLFLALFINFTLLNSFANAAISNWQEEVNQSVKVRVLASYYEESIKKKINYQKPIIGVEFQLKKGWKIYGKNSGNIGIEPQFDFSGSTYYRDHKVSWPKSIKVKEDFGDISYEYSIYKNKIIIPIDLFLSQVSDQQKIKLKINYSLCKEICIPASKEFIINLDRSIDIEALKQINHFYSKKLLADKSPSISPKKGILFMLLVAIIGGAVLNIMPCVLPVLSIKLISIVDHSTAQVRKIRHAFLATILGILSCFVVLASMAIAIKITGNTMGWGLQFQNPYFLVTLIIILVFFTANLLGVYEINLGRDISNIINRYITKRNENHKLFFTNYLSGILAVLLATPCSAPFLGSAISFALTQSYSMIILVFFAIGVGFSMPYLILSAAPKLVYLLPKPGPWMNSFKQLMSGFLIATIIWLVYVLIGIIGNLPAYIVSFLAVIMVGSLRIKIKSIRYILITILTATLFTLPFYLKKDKDIRVAQYNSIWHNFVEKDIAKYVDQGKIVVIDVTADWCVTCKINKIRVLENSRILERLKQDDIIAMQADITRPRPEVMQFMAKYKRYAIPFNVVFGPNAKSGILTSELPSVEELLDIINKSKEISNN